VNHFTTSLRDAAGTPARGTLRIVRGDATPEEVAALVAVLAARGGGGEPPAEAPPSEWARPRPRRPLPSPGPGAWRAAARDERTRADW
jgi:hypothetical protein